MTVGERSEAHESTGVGVVAWALAGVRWWLWGSEAELKLYFSESLPLLCNLPLHLPPPHHPLHHHPGKLSSA